MKLAPGPVGDHYRKLLRAKGKPKATVAVARKFCSYLYSMLKEEWSYTECRRACGALLLRTFAAEPSRQAAKYRSSMLPHCSDTESPWHH